MRQDEYIGDEISPPPSDRSETFSLRAHLVIICVSFLPHSFGVSLSKIFFLWKSRIILIRVMMIMPSLIKVMEVIMTGIITQLAMEAIISIAV